MSLYYPRAHWQNPSQPVTGPGPKGVRGTRVVHYPGNNGGAPPLTDAEMCTSLRAMQNDYVTNRGYSLGYSFVVSQSGLAYEARGFTYNNAANKGDKMKPGISNFNAVSMSIQVAVSGQDAATPAAVAKVNAIIALEPSWDVVIHGDVDYTACCGEGMTEQVRSGIIGQHPTPIPPPIESDTEMPDNLILWKVKGTSNVFAVSLGVGATHLSEVTYPLLVARLAAAGMSTDIIETLHDQEIKSVLFNAGIDLTDLVPL